MPFLGSEIPEKDIYREGRLIYQINGQGSLNGTSGSASCPSGEVLVGYSGIQICEGVDLLQVDPVSAQPIALSHVDGSQKIVTQQV